MTNARLALRPALYRSDVLFLGCLRSAVALWHDGHGPRRAESLCGSRFGLLCHRRDRALLDLAKEGGKGQLDVCRHDLLNHCRLSGSHRALGIILALVFKGSPVFVMPLVFGFAPIVNTLVTAWMGGTLNKISPVFVGGIMAAALGAGGVLYFKPPAKPAAALAQVSHDTPAETESSDTRNKPISETPEPADKGAAAPSAVKSVEPETKSSSVPSLDKPATDKPSANTPSPEKSATEAPAPVKPVEVAPLFAAQPSAGSPPVPVKPIIAVRPDDGQPPVPTKREPDLIATAPDAGQPPKPDEVKTTTPPATTKPAGTDLPPPVVNPDSEPFESPAKPTATEPKAVEPTKPEPTTEAPKPDAPKAEATPAKELPPPVPNPDADFNAQQRVRRISSRFVSMVDIQATATASDKPASENDESKETKEAASAGHHDAATKPNTGMIALSILMAAVCWGSYGPMLHKGQMKMGGSRLRPFACVGIAYFIIAVAVPLVLLYTTPTISQGAWNVKGLSWSIIAGGAGALGALGIILAFNAGGKPIYVMPLVFGFAPVINTFISLTEAGTWSEVETMFWVSLGVVIAGAITVLITAPKAGHGPAHAPAAAGAK